MKCGNLRKKSVSRLFSGHVDADHILQRRGKCTALHCYNIQFLQDGV